MVENTIGIIAMAIVLYTMTRFRLSFVQLTLMELARIGIAIYALMGMFSLESLYNYYCTVIIAFCIGMMIGHYQFTKLKGPFAQDSIDNLSISSHKHSLIRASIVFGLFIVYHYSIAGVPFFSHEYEMKRFLVASSGLFGIPSRISVYGPIIITIFSLLYFSKNVLSHREIAGILFLSLLCFWLTGHKSSVVAFIYSIICIYRYIDEAVHKRHFFVIFAGLFVISLASVAIQLPYFYSLENFGFWDYIKVRLSFISIHPLIFIYYDAPDISTITPFAFVHDLLYPFLKLFGQEIYTVNTQISYGLYGTEYGEFTVPVAYTYVGYALIEFGKNGGLIISLIIGYLSAALYFRTQREHNQVKLATFVAFEYFWLIGLTTGNLFYLIPNALVTLVMFLILLKIFRYKLIIHKNRQLS